MAKQITSKNSFLINSSATPTASDIITTNEFVFVNPKAKTIETQDMGNGELGNVKSVTIADWTTAEFDVNINVKPSGTAGTAPSYAALFKACGLTENIDTTNNIVTYAPGGTPAGFAKNYIDGSVRSITGIAGDFKLSGSVGEIAKFTFSLKGFSDLAETAEANPTVTLDANPNLVVTSATAITVGGGTINLQEFEFSMGNEIQESYGIGVKEFYISDFKPTITVKAIKTKGNATHWDDLKNNTLKEVKVILGSGAGNTITFTASYCNPNDVSESDDSGEVVYNQTWICQSTVGNDNFSIVYS